MCESPVSVISKPDEPPPCSPNVLRFFNDTRCARPVSVMQVHSLSVRVRRFCSLPGTGQEKKEHEDEAK